MISAGRLSKWPFTLCQWLSLASLAAATLAGSRNIRAALASKLCLCQLNHKRFFRTLQEIYNRLGGALVLLEVAARRRF